MGVPKGTIRATVLSETILAAFEVDEILYELRVHSAGLNVTRHEQRTLARYNRVISNSR